MAELCLDPLTCPNSGPVEIVRLAADIEVPLVGLLVNPGSTSSPEDRDLLGDTPARRATRDACQAAGVQVDMIESFYLRPETELESFLPALESGAWLGARRLGFVTQDPDASRLLDRTHAFLDMVRDHGLEALLEFTPRMTQKTLADAVAFLGQLDRPELRIHVDALHVARSGTPLNEIAAQTDKIIGRAQLCDGPATVTDEEGRNEALHRRLMPGDGVLPLKDLLAALPPGIVIGLEVPQDGFEDLPGTLESRVRRGMAIMRDWVAETERLRAAS